MATALAVDEVDPLEKLNPTLRLAYLHEHAVEFFVLLEVVFQDGCQVVAAVVEEWLEGEGGVVDYLIQLLIRMKHILITSRYV